MRKIIVMGPVGSGKSTQAQLLAREFGVPLLNTGDLLYFRSMEESGLGREIKEKMEAGEIVNDELVSRLVEEHLQTKAYQAGFVLDGFPRSLNQAKKLAARIERVIYLRVSDKENTKRLLRRGRQDDTSQLIAKRLKIYHHQTKPMLAYYREKGILEEVDGERPVEVIFRDILKRLKR